MIDILLSLFFFLAIIIGFASSFLVLFSKRNYSQSFFLGLFVFSLTVVSIYNFYLSVNTFKNLPNFFIITKSFIFLAAPSAFLYVRNVLFSNKLLRKYDLLHFLPFVIYFGLIIFVWIGSYFGLPIIGFLSNKIDSPFSMLSLTIWMLYAFCQTMMILNYDAKAFKENDFHLIKVFGWIRVFNLAILFLFSTLFVYYFLIKKIDREDFSCYIMISFVLFFTVGWVYFKPQIFYDSNCLIKSFDLSSHNSRTGESKNMPPLVKELSAEKKEEYLKKLDIVFSDKKLFLKKDFLIRDLSDETGISVRHLSNLINSEFNLHFQDFVNLKRIEYFNEKINDLDWKDLSLEGMAWGAGFKSRTTCFRAFIKHTGKSPSEYLKIIKCNPDEDIKCFLNKLNEF